MKNDQTMMQAKLKRLENIAQIKLANMVFLSTNLGIGAKT